jgi:hypothetical protein
VAYDSNFGSAALDVISGSSPDRDEKTLRACKYLLTTKRNYSNYVAGILRAGRDAWRIVLIESKETKWRIPEPASLSCLTGEAQLHEGVFYQTKPKDEMNCKSMSYL